MHSLNVGYLPYLQVIGSKLAIDFLPNSCSDLKVSEHPPPQNTFVDTQVGFASRGQCSKSHRNHFHRTPCSVELKALPERLLFQFSAAKFLRGNRNECTTCSSVPYFNKKKTACILQPLFLPLPSKEPRKGCGRKEGLITSYIYSYDSCFYGNNRARTHKNVEHDGLMSWLCTCS